MKIHRKLAILLFCLISQLLFLHCSPGRPAVELCSIGAPEFNQLIDAWGALYRRSHSNSLPIIHDGRGDGAAIKNLINPICQISVTTRELNPSEIEKVTAAAGSAPTGITVARDGVAVIVNSSSNRKSISMTELRTLYLSGNSAPNGSQEKIFSLSHDYPDYHWLRAELLTGKNYSSQVALVGGPLSMVEQIGANRQGLGYARLSVLNRQVRTIPVTVNGSKPVMLSAQTIGDGSYPLQRRFYIYFNRSPGQPLPTITRRFLELILSPEGQSILKPLGYFPLSTDELNSARQKLR